jgi:hypothetical protein
MKIVKNMKNTMQKLLIGLVVVTLATGAISVITPGNSAALAGSDFNASRIMDDPIFFDSSRMSAQDIQNFLNSKVPSCDTWGTKMYNSSQTRAQYAATKGIGTPFTCLKDFRQNIPAKNADQFCNGIGTGSDMTAASILKTVADACNINPMVLIVLLQKEQSLITDDWPWPIQYRSATGYGCPDTAPCDAEYYGFFNQVYSASRQFQRYSKQPELFGYRANRSNFVQYNPNAGCGGSSVYIQNNTTAALYNYTPYQPNSAALNNLYGTGDGCSAYGNRNFWRMYNDWFGPTVTDYCFYGPASPYIATVGFRKIRQNIDWGNVSVYSGSGTNCIESHTWGQGFGSWNQNTASNHPVINPSDGVVKYADLDGDGRDEPVLIGWRTGTGMVEFHVWQQDMKKWVVHAVSNLSTSDLSNLAIDFADLDGDKRDEPVVFGYKDTSTGMIEFHVWNEGLGSWKQHWVSNLPVIDPAKMNIAFADLNGDGKDEGVVMGIKDTSTGMIEFHVWNNGFGSWRQHFATNHPVIDPDNTTVTFADIDGNGVDEGVLIGKRYTGSGKIEFHAWNPGFQSWKGHWASNLASF